MHPDLIPISGIDDLERLIAESESRPVLLFKHSRSCGVSVEALDELIEHLSANQADAQYAMVTVQTHRELSNAVSARLGVRHETPQAIVVRGGQVRWSASHFRVNAASIDKALRSA